MQLYGVSFPRLLSLQNKKEREWPNLCQTGTVVTSCAAVGHWVSLIIVHLILLGRILCKSTHVVSVVVVVAARARCGSSSVDDYMTVRVHDSVNAWQMIVFNNIFTFTVMQFSLKKRTFV